MVVDVRIRLFGEVGWSVADDFLPVRGAMRLAVILSLVEARGSIVSVESLLARLWPEPPRSGANAVQRHVSALRNQLQELGVADPRRIIERVNGGYRLEAVTSELDELDELVRTGSHDLERVNWWDEPLIGAPWEPVQTLRSSLQFLASDALTKWAANVPANRAAEVTARADYMLAHTPECFAAVQVRRRSQEDRRNESTEVIGREEADQLRAVAGLWAHDRTTEALDLLESSAAPLPHDLSRRVCRALIWLTPNDPWPRHAMSMLIEGGVANRVQHERSVVTIDARVLEEHTDGQATSLAEVDAAEGEPELVRALRVAFIYSLSSPYDPVHDRLVDRLSSIDNPDAQVESRRFRFISQLRRGEIAAAFESLLDYHDAVALHWPGTGDDFAPMARAALQLSSCAPARSTFGPSSPEIGSFVADRWVLSVAQAARRLLQNDPREPLTDTNYHIAIDTVSRSAQQGMALLRDLNAGRPVRERAHALAGALPACRREKQFLMLPIALGVVGEALHDAGLAHAAAAALRPWRGQMLGMWPVDFLFGPADEWLARFDAI